MNWTASELPFWKRVKFAWLILTGQFSISIQYVQGGNPATQPPGEA